MSEPFNDAVMKTSFTGYSALLQHPDADCSQAKSARLTYPHDADGVTTAPVASECFKELVGLGYEVVRVDLTRNIIMEKI